MHCLVGRTLFVILSEAKDLALSPCKFYGMKFTRWFASAGKTPNLKHLRTIFQVRRARSFASLRMTGWIGFGSKRWLTQADRSLDPTSAPVILSPALQDEEPPYFALLVVRSAHNPWIIPGSFALNCGAQDDRIVWLRFKTIGLLRTVVPLTQQAPLSLDSTNVNCHLTQQTL